MLGTRVCISTKATGCVVVGAKNLDLTCSGVLTDGILKKRMDPGSLKQMMKMIR